MMLQVTKLLQMILHMTFILGILTNLLVKIYPMQLLEVMFQEVGLVNNKILQMGDTTLLLILRIMSSLEITKYS